MLQMLFHPRELIREILTNHVIAMMTARMMNGVMNRFVGTHAISSIAGGHLTKSNKNVKLQIISQRVTILIISFTFSNAGGRSLESIPYTPKLFQLLTLRLSCFSISEPEVT